MKGLLVMLADGLNPIELQATTETHPCEASSSLFCWAAFLPLSAMCRFSLDAANLRQFPGKFDALSVLPQWKFVALSQRDQVCSTIGYRL